MRGTPNRDAEIVVRQYLKELDPLLDIEWMDLVGRYALVCQWPEVDKRWALYRDGSIGEPKDILGWFVEGIQDASGLPIDPLDMLDRILEWLGKMNNEREDWSTRMKKTVSDNAELRRRRKQAIVDETMDVTEYYQKLHFGEGTVNLGDGSRESIQVPEDKTPTGVSRRVYAI